MLGNPRGRPARGGGLSQGQMDLLLGSDPGTYGRLERGEIAHPEPWLLDAVATLFEMRPDERETLYKLAAGARPATPPTVGAGKSVGGDWQQVLDSSTEIAFITDITWRIVAWNQAFTNLLREEPGAAEPAVPENILAWILFDPHVRDALRARPRRGPRAGQRLDPAAGTTPHHAATTPGPPP